MSSRTTDGDGKDDTIAGVGRARVELDNVIAGGDAKADDDAGEALPGGGGLGEAAGQADGIDAAAENISEKISARAMKFRAMISKFRPEKKVVVVKVCASMCC